MTDIFMHVSEYDFFTKIEDIKKHLERNAPEWHVNMLFEPYRENELPLRKLFTCAQHNFTHGPSKKKYPQSVFGYIEADKHYIYPEQVFQIMSLF